MLVPSTLHLLLLLLTSTLIFAKTIHFDEICDVSGRRVYLEMGENGLLTSRNRTSSYRNADCKRCNLEIITCPSCVIRYKFNFTITASTEKFSNNCDDCVSTYELPFETTSSRRFCGGVKSDLEFQNTKTRSLSVVFFFNAKRGGGFNFEYSSQRNRQFLVELANKSQQTFTTPFFPAFYPTDLSVEYVIDCKSTPGCTITLLFADFLVSSSSLIEFFDWNGRRLFLTTGAIFRPPAITSSGPTLVVKFFANGGTNLGFKAEYSFNVSVGEVVTDCGGFVEASGGVIAFTRSNHTLYNCFWIVKPSRNYFNWKTHLYLTVTSFSNFKNDSTLTIHKGTTSNDEILETVTPATHKLHQKHTTSLTTGFYLALKATPLSQPKLLITYAAFSDKDCYTDANFLCENQRCISILLHCDGFDHCGDNSDEAGDCKRTLPGFLGSFYDFRTAAAIFVICSLGITCLIFGVIVLLYRININNQNPRRYQNHLETINAILEEGSLRGDEALDEEEVIIQRDEPPDYEPPPNYEEIVKACNSQNSPPPAYSIVSHNHKKMVNEKWFQWLNVGRNFNRNKERGCGRLVVSYSDGNLERCFDGFNGGGGEEGVVIRRSQSTDSFMS